MNKVTINGKTITISGGKNVSVINGKVYVDGVEYKKDPSSANDEKLVVIVQANIDKLEVQSEEQVTIEGNVSGSVKVNGSLNCGNISGGANAGGSINCGDVEGNVSSGGSTNCGDVKGNVNAGGSVRRS